MSYIEIYVFRCLAQSGAPLSRFSLLALVRAMENSRC